MSLLDVGRELAMKKYKVSDTRPTDYLRELGKKFPSPEKTLEIDSSRKILSSCHGKSFPGPDCYSFLKFPALAMEGVVVSRVNMSSCFSPIH